MDGGPREALDGRWVPWRGGVWQAEEQGPRGHSGGAGGPVQGRSAHCRRGGGSGWWAHGTVGGGLSPWRMSPEMEACLPEFWSPTRGECGVQSRQEGGGSPRGESALPDPPRPWRGWLGFCLGLAALGMERRGPEEGNAGRGEFLRGWGFWPWDLGPTQGPGAELGPTAGIQGVGSALPASVGPENRPPPRCRCSQWAQGRKMMSRLRRGPPPQPCQPPLPQATPGSLSGRAASPGQPHVVFLNPWPPCWAVEPGRGQASPPSGVWGGL